MTDGSETGVPYLHGVVVREDFAEKYPEVVVAFVKAVYQAGRWIDADPLRATEMMEKWTGVEKEVLDVYFSRGGHLTLDPTIKPQWVDTLKFYYSVLARENLVPPLDFDSWVTDRYIRGATPSSGLITTPRGQPPGRSGHGERGPAERDLAAPATGS